VPASPFTATGSIVATGRHSTLHSPVPISGFVTSHSVRIGDAVGVARRPGSIEGDSMRLRLVVSALTAMFFASGNYATAHHSFAMFDQDNQVDLEGVVQEFRFIAPHTFIILEVKQEDGTTEVWALEGVSPSALAREGWTRTSLRPGDEIKLRVAPLRSGVPGGAWVTQQIKFRDGKPVAVNP
jgi:hypothetical protein